MSTSKLTYYNIIKRLMIVAACSVAGLIMPQPAQAQKPLEVVASFSILQDMTRAIGGERIAVTSLVGPGVDAHGYRTKPQDVKLIGAAQLIVMNGLGFDPFIDRAAKAVKTRAPIVVASKGITVLRANPASHGHGHSHSHGHSHGSVDPHAWQSLDAAMIYVRAIRDGLIAADVAGKAHYEARAEAYLAELGALKREIEALFAPYSREKRVIVTNHDSFAYLGREFGLTIEAIQGLSTEGEPNARDVARILKAVRDKKARAIFVESISSERLAAQIAKESGAKIGGILFSDALSDEKGPAPTYIAMMRHNARTIAAALAE